MPLDRRIVGRVPGVISAISPEWASVGSGDLKVKGYDFAIGSMGFRVMASPQTPYQRETIQYRKEQFDSAPVVGEQSLDGYWLRSQQSFHHGAGVKFYEVLEGDTVLNRYRTAIGLNPWEPGEVTMVDEFAAPEGTNIIDAVPGTSSAINGVFTLTSGGDIVFRHAAGNTTYTDGGTSVSITTDGNKLYAAVGNLIKVQDGTTTLATLITHGDGGATWQGVWWAKGRLFAVDSNDNWFALPPVVATVTATPNAFWKPGTIGASWCLTETPAFVLIGAGIDIYAITISETGGVPSLTAPVTVAQVPIGETIASLHHYLGFVGISTQRGFRVGQADLSSGTPVMVYGPILIEGDFSGNKRLAAFGSEMYAIGEHEDYDDAATLFSVNLEQQVADLRPAWTAWQGIASAKTAFQGSVFDANGVMWAWANTQIRRQDPTLPTTGTLQTGQLRFGTLEHKLFRTIRVRAEGTGGTVGISTVLADGTTNFILSMDVATTNEIDLTVGLTEPIESLGFIFTLLPDVGDDTIRPTLLGYQVRSLPAPERQRMIRVPLQIEDTERNRRGVDRGRTGDAWARLSALEDLEARQVLTQFVDFRTGEAGVAQIESLTFQGERPTKNASDNFGGVVYLELRKVG